MAGRFKLRADEHWSKAHIKAARGAQSEVVRVAPGRLVRFLEELAVEETPFAGVIRFITPKD